MSEKDNVSIPDEKFTPDRQENKTNKVKAWFDGKVIPAMGKMGNQTHLSAIRDSFGTLIPLLVAGSIGLLVSFIIFGNGGTGRVSLLGLIAKAATDWDWDIINTFNAAADPGNSWALASQIGGSMFGALSDISIGAMSIYFSFLFGYFVATSRGAKNTIMAGFVSLGSFWIANMGQIAWSAGAQGLISAIIFGIISTELFVWLTKQEKLKITLPGAVPPAIGNSFSVLLPIVIVFTTIGVSNIIVLAPAIASTHWAVTGQKSMLIDAPDFMAKWTDEAVLASLKGLDLTGTPWENQDIINQLVNGIWGVGDLNTEAGADQFINWFNGLGDSDKALVSTFLSVNVFGNGANIGAYDSLATIKLTFVEGQGVMSVFSFQEILIGSSQFGWGQAIFQFFTSWFIGLAMSDAGLALALINTFFASFFWFFGVHGANVMAAIFDPVGFMVTSINIALYTQLGMTAAIATGEMSYWGAMWGKWYVDIGGSGGTLALIIMTWFLSSKRELKTLGKYAFPAGLFGINEPVLFGWPLVLNGRYAIPFVLIPIISIFPYYIAGPVLKFINPPILVLPWTTPSILGAVLSNLDYRSLVPFFITFAMQLILWTPFILIDNKLTFKKLKVEDPEKYEFEMKYKTDKAFRTEVKAQEKAEREKEKELAKVRAEKRKARNAARKQQA